MIELAILIASLHSSVCIAQHNLNTFFASEFLFIITFDTKFADIIARLIVIIFFYVRWRDLTHIT